MAQAAVETKEKPPNARGSTIVMGKKSDSANPIAEHVRTGIPKRIDAGSGREYLVLEELGRGGMGVVLDTEYTTRVIKRQPRAVKLLSADLVADDEQRERFIAEVGILIALEHPNIVRVLDGDIILADPIDPTEFDNCPYFAMERLIGKPLAKVLDEEGMLNWPTVRTIALQMCAGLAHAHVQGIIHRDMKPDNVFLVDPGADTLFRVKLLDFGIAKLIAAPIEQRVPGITSRTANRILDHQRRHRTEVGMIQGTPYYMSPEQARGNPLDHRTDIYSVGVMMYEMLTGRQPFEGSTVHEILRALMINTAAPFANVAPELEFPPNVERLVMKCMEKDPDDRFQTVPELIEAVEECNHSTGPIYSLRPRPKVVRFEQEQLIDEDETNGTELLGPDESPAPDQSGIRLIKPGKSVKQIVSDTGEDGYAEDAVVPKGELKPKRKIWPWALGAAAVVLVVGALTGVTALNALQRREHPRIRTEIPASINMPIEEPLAPTKTHATVANNQEPPAKAPETIIPTSQIITPPPEPSFEVPASELLEPVADQVRTEEPHVESGRKRRRSNIVRPHTPEPTPVITGEGIRRRPLAAPATEQPSITGEGVRRRR